MPSETVAKPRDRHGARTVRGPYPRRNKANDRARKAIVARCWGDVPTADCRLWPEISRMRSSRDVLIPRDTCLTPRVKLNAAGGERLT